MIDLKPFSISEAGFKSWHGLRHNEKVKEIYFEGQVCGRLVMVVTLTYWNQNRFFIYIFRKGKFYQMMRRDMMSVMMLINEWRSENGNTK